MVITSGLISLHYMHKSARHFVSKNHLQSYHLKLPTGIIIPKNHSYYCIHIYAEAPQLILSIVSSCYNVIINGVKLHIMIS